MGDGDRREALQAAFVEDRLAKYPQDFAANYNMGDILLTKGDAAGAITFSRTPLARIQIASSRPPS